MACVSKLVGLLSIIHSNVFAKFEAGGMIRKAVYDPKVIGYAHTDAFEQLANKYVTKKPATKTDVLNDMTDILYSYCPVGHSRCRSLADEAMALAVKTIGGDGDIDIAYPEGIDDSLVVMLDQMFETVDKIEKDNLDEVIETLTDIQTQVEEMEGVGPYFKYMSHAATGISIESSQLWHRVQNDPEHGLYNITFPDDADDGRRLQGTTACENFIPRIDLVGFFVLKPATLAFNFLVGRIPGLIPIPYVGAILFWPVFFVFDFIFLIGYTFMSTAFSTVGMLACKISSTVVKVIDAIKPSPDNSTTPAPDVATSPAFAPFSSSADY